MPSSAVQTILLRERYARAIAMIATAQVAASPRNAGTKVPVWSYTAPTATPETDPNKPTPVLIQAWI